MLTRVPGSTNVCTGGRRGQFDGHIDGHRIEYRRLAANVNERVCRGIG
jgi:hypothetical protein